MNEWRSEAAALALWQQAALDALEVMTGAGLVSGPGGRPLSLVALEYANRLVQEVRGRQCDRPDVADSGGQGEADREKNNPSPQGGRG